MEGGGEVGHPFVVGLRDGELISGGVRDHKGVEKVSEV